MTVGTPRTGELSDEDLIRLFAVSGSADYFAELYSRHRRRVFNACYGFFGEAAVAADCTQETFVRAMSNGGQFREGDFRAWLLTIARNACRDQYRKRRPDIPLDVKRPELPVQLVVPSTGSSVHLALMQLHKEIDLLPKNQRECLEMKTEGYSYEETAASTGLTTEAVRSHLQNARRTLRSRMQDVLREIL